MLEVVGFCFVEIFLVICCLNCMLEAMLNFSDHGPCVMCLVLNKYL